MTTAVSGIERRIESPFGTHELSGGRGRESISRWMIRSTLSSGNIPHLRAHARFRLRERRADRPRLDSELPSDLAVVETEIELSDHHRPLALGQPREQPPHFHPVKKASIPSVDTRDRAWSRRSNDRPKPRRPERTATTKSQPARSSSSAGGRRKPATNAS